MEGTKNETEMAQSEMAQTEEEMGGFRRLSDPNKTADDAQRVIVKDDSSDSVNSDPNGTDTARMHPGPTTGFRGKLNDIMYSQEFQIIVIVLVIVDCILVVGELILDFSSLEDNQCPINETIKAMIKPDHNVKDVHTNAENTNEKVEAAMVLHYMSLTILSIFMVELLFKLIALGKEFFHHKLEIFDAFVIISSFILDIISLVYEEAFAALELLVLLRLWRIVRVVNGVIVSVETQADKKIETQKRLREEVEHELEKFRQYCNVQEKEIEVLREEMKRHGISIDEDLLSEKPKGLGNQMDVIVEVNKVNEKSDSSDSEKPDSKETIPDSNYINNGSTPTTPTKEQYQEINDGSEC